MRLQVDGFVGISSHAKRILPLHVSGIPLYASDALLCNLLVAFLEDQSEGKNSSRVAANEDPDDEMSLLAAPTAAPTASVAPAPAVAQGRYNLADSSDSD